MPKVSIIVPCYNVEKYLDRCVTSLINQTLEDIEIILVDDGSPDAVPKMCDEYAQKDARIKVIHKKNAGLGMACNSGIEIAVGEYIAFCDSDDCVDSDCYQTLYDYAKETKSDAVFSGIKRVNQNGIETLMFEPKIDKTYRKSNLEDFIYGMIAAPVSSPFEREREMSAKIVIYAKSIIETYNVRFKSERQYISEDLIFNLDFLCHCTQVSELSKSFYYYFVNTSSLTQTLRKDRFEKNLFLRDYLLSHYKTKSSIDLRNRVNKMFIGYARTVISQIVSSTESFQTKYRMISLICSHRIWKELNEDYPVNLLPITKRFVFWLTLYNQPMLLFFLFSLKKK